MQFHSTFFYKQKRIKENHGMMKITFGKFYKKYYKIQNKLQKKNYLVPLIINTIL